MNSKTFILSLAIAVIVILFGFSLVVNNQAVPNFSFGGNLNTTSHATSTAVTLDSQGTATLVIGNNQKRVGLQIVNDSSSVVYLHMVDASASTTVGLNAGVRLNANGGSVEFPANLLYLGPIHGTSTDQTAVLTVTEYD